VNVIFQSTPEALARIIPAPLTPNPDAIAVVYWAMFKMTEPYQQAYNEVGVSIPVAYKGIPGAYFAYMYLDNAPGIACGREIWGFPKKDATISIDDNAGKSTVTVTRMGVEIVKATFEARSKLSEIPPYPYQVFYNLKIIPSVSKGAGPEVMQLTSIPVVRKSEQVHVGAGTIQFGTSPYDLLGEIPILGIVYSQIDVHQMSLGYGDVVFDYLRSKQLTGAM
jgi:acetoacetate decarboxylase